MATDNAASALGRILEHHGDAVDGAAVAAAWVAALPLKADTVEALPMHDLLVRLLEVGARAGRGPWLCTCLARCTQQPARRTQPLCAALSATLSATRLKACLPPCLQARDARVLGAGNQAVPHLVGAMVAVLGRGTKLVAGDVGLRMAALLQQLQAAVPAEVATQAVARLNSKQQARLQAYMSGSVPE
jgi:hypothetical protein